MTLLSLLLQHVTDPSAAFAEGAGVNPLRYRGLLLIALAGSLVAWCIWVLKGLLDQWNSSQITTGDLWREIAVVLLLVTAMLGMFAAGL